MSEWNSPFIKGFSTCFTICSVIGAVAIYFNTTFISLKDEEIARLQKEVTKQEDFSEKYHEEQAIRRQLELREAELKEQLAILESKKWEEKYLSEHLAKQTAKEQLALLEVRNKDLAKSIKNKKPDPKKDLEIQHLKNELNLTQKELNKLRALYTQVKTKSEVPTKITANKGIKSTISNEKIFEMVKVSVPNLGSSTTRDFLISTYQGTNHKITITQLSEIVYQMGSTNTLKAIQALSKNIVNDNNPKSLQKVLSNMGSSNSQAALKYLVK